MAELSLILYIISVLDSLSGFAFVIFIINAIIATLLAIAFVVIGADYGIEDAKKELGPVWKAIQRPYIALSIGATAVLLLVPSENTMYTMAGLYAGDKVMTAMADNEIAQQAQRTLLAKLKELEKSAEPSSDKDSSE